MKTSYHFFYSLIIIPQLLFSITHLAAQKFTKLEAIEKMCFYQLEYSPDSMNILDKQEEEFAVFVGRTIIHSQSSNSLIPLQYIKTDDLDGFLAAMTKGNIPRTNFNTAVLYNYPVGKITFTDKIALDAYLFKEDISILNWKLHNETRTINNYNTQKATLSYGEREWTAWFATDVPINAGPYVFQGLPGLIVEIVDSEQHYHFTLKSVSEPEVFENIEFYEQAYIESSSEDFMKARNRFSQNPHHTVMQSVNASGASMTFDDEQGAVSAISSNTRRRNNPIELSPNP